MGVVWDDGDERQCCDGIRVDMVLGEVVGLIVSEDLDDVLLVGSAHDDRDWCRVVCAVINFIPHFYW